MAFVNGIDHVMEYEGWHTLLGLWKSETPRAQLRSTRMTESPLKIPSVFVASLMHLIHPDKVPPLAFLLLVRAESEQAQTVQSGTISERHIRLKIDPSPFSPPTPNNYFLNTVIKWLYKRIMHRGTQQRR
jgi:hypothetical protein